MPPNVSFKAMMAMHGAWHQVETSIYIYPLNEYIKCIKTYQMYQINVSTKAMLAMHGELLAAKRNKEISEDI